MINSGRRGVGGWTVESVGMAACRGVRRAEGVK